MQAAAGEVLGNRVFSETRADDLQLLADMLNEIRILVDRDRDLDNGSLLCLVELLHPVRDRIRADTESLGCLLSVPATGGLEL